MVAAAGLSEGIRTESFKARREGLEDYSLRSLSGRVFSSI